jgi:DNA-directed RNA polymerase subunit H (RpoH/RPB5)
MLQDRNIDINDANKTLIQQSVEQNASKMGFEVELPNIKIIYYLSPKYKWSELKKYFQEVDQEALYILVVNDKVSQSNMKTLNELNLNMQIFDLKELQFNITKHVLVPRHEIVKDQDEIKDVLESYALKSKYQLPVIMKTDPMSRYLGLKNGDIVKITRNSPTSGEYVIYRCCI